MHILIFYQCLNDERVLSIQNHEYKVPEVGRKMVVAPLIWITSLDLIICLTRSA